MSEIIPNLEVATPERCLNCVAVLHKIRVEVGEIACLGAEEAQEAERQWTEYLEPCEGDPDVIGDCGEKQQKCKHPDGRGGIIAWRPRLENFRN